MLFGPVKIRSEAPEGYTFLGWKDHNGQWASREKECVIEKGGCYSASYEKMFRTDVSPVCINEVSADNDIYVNDYGKRADWIELYNRSEIPINVTGMFFSDDPLDPTKYRLETVRGENTYIQPNRHIVIWCDGKAPQTQPHLPFKLKNADGVSYHFSLPTGNGQIAFDMVCIPPRNPSEDIMTEGVRIRPFTIPPSECGI